MNIYLGCSWFNHLLYFTCGFARRIWSGPCKFKLYLRSHFTSSHWNVGPEEAAETSKGKIQVFLVQWLLSWDRKRSLRLAGIEKIRDQGEVLQCSLMTDTSVLHLKPGGGKLTWVKDKICISINSATNTFKISSPLKFLPVSRRDDVVYWGWWRVCGDAEWLTQTVGPCFGENEPVSNVELRQQTVLHYLVQVIPRGAPQAAAEHWRIQGALLLKQRAEIFYWQIQHTLSPKGDENFSEMYSTGLGLGWQI